jgi:hypothetical protein
MLLVVMTFHSMCAEPPTWYTLIARSVTLLRFGRIFRSLHDGCADAVILD